MKKGFAALLAMLAASSAFATTGGTIIANNGVGASYVAAAGADYTSLAAAAADFNALAGGLTGNYTIFIEGDLTEAANVGFGNATNGFTLTIKPAPTVTSTITFTATATNTGIPGHLVIGAANLNGTADDVVATPGVVIDGSNQASGTDRSLTITNTAGALPACYLVRVYGNCDNVVIKNCNITDVSTAVSVNAAVAFTMRNLLAPDNGTVQNCNVSNIAAAGTNAVYGIMSELSGTAAAGNAINNIHVIGNLVQSRQRTIWFNFMINGEVIGNTVKTLGNQAAYTVEGITHQGCNSTGGNWTFSIKQNTIDQIQSAQTTNGQGIIAINCAAGTTGATYNVENNMVSGFAFTATNAGTGTNCRGIAFANGSVGNAYHNSVYIPAIPQLTSTANNAAFQFGIGARAMPSTLNVFNNIIKIDHASGACLQTASTVAANLNSDYNVLYRSAGYIGMLGNALTSTAHATLAGWQGVKAGLDTHSTSVDPSTMTGSAWASATNLHFSPATAKPVELVGAPMVGSVNMDIDGDARNTAGSALVYPGADEIPGFPVPVRLSGLTVD